MSKIQRLAGLALAATAAIGMSACSSDETPAANNSSSAPAPATSSATSESSSAAAAAGNGVTTPDQVFGAACSKLPQGDAPGGLTAMGPQPVATAASTNPLLTKLVAAVGAADLGTTLNTTDNLTVFAPYDGAFDALGAEAFKALAADPAKLAPILQEHVVAMRYDKDGLLAAKTLKSLNPNGKELTIEGSGDNITVNGAKVLCGNIPTKNATVFVIDTVLTP